VDGRAEVVLRRCSSAAMVRLAAVCGHGLELRENFKAAGRSTKVELGKLCL
jgi:hypothetical protein